MAIKRSIWALIFFILFCHEIIAKGGNSFLLNNGNKEAEINKSKPIIGFGPGLITFYGDVGRKDLKAPFKFKFGYHLNIEKNLTGNLKGAINLLLGSIYGEEKSESRNLNFKSTIFSQGLNLTYYFNNKKDDSRIPFLSPFVSAGFGFLYYKPMGDLKNSDGTYYYWTDGSIKDKKEPDTSAVVIQRDYEYETDLRKENIDGLGNYLLITAQMPLCVGTQINISNRLSLKLSATYYYTFTDNIDNVSKNSINNHEIFGDRKGDKSKDRYLYSSLSMVFDLSFPKYQKPYEVDDAGLIVLDIRDSDKDGITDKDDHCPGTPRGVPVDKDGCPPDDDNDGVPNYLDKEPKTRKDALVNLNGVEIKEGIGSMKPLLVESFVSEGDTSQDGAITRRDSVYKFDPINESRYDSTSTETISGIEDLSSDTSFAINIEAEDTSKNMGNDDKEQDNLILTDTTETMTNREESDTSTKEKETLASTQEVKEQKEVQEKTSQVKSSQLPSGVIYQVQVGAFQKEVPLEKVNTLLSMEGIIKTTSPEGIDVLTIGEFRNFESAEELRKIITKKGIEDAFVIAFLDGQKISVQEAKELKKPSISKGDTLLVQGVNKQKTDEVTIVTIQNGDTALLTIPFLNTTRLVEDTAVIEKQPPLRKGDSYVVKNIDNTDTIIAVNTINENDTTIFCKDECTIFDFAEGDIIEITNIGNNDTITVANISQKDTVLVTQVHPEEYIQSFPADDLAILSNLKKGDTLFVSTVSTKDSSLIINITTPENKTFESKVKEKPIQEEKTVKELVSKIDAIEFVKPAVSEEKGLVYRVQIGAFRYAVPLDLFSLFMKSNIKEVEYRFYSIDSLTRYTSGTFNSYQDAIKRKQNVVSNGIQDAFIVAFNNGERLSLKEAWALNTQNPEVMITNPPSETINTTINDTANLKTSSFNDGLIFKVQIGAYLFDKPLDLFQNIEAVTSEPGPHELTRYTAGVFRSIEAVNIFKEDVIAKGFKDAFVISYNNTIRIPIEEANNLIKQKDKKEKEEYDNINRIEIEELKNLNIYPNKNTNLQSNTVSVNTEKNKTVIFKVQVGVFRQGVPPKLWDIFQTIDGLKSYKTTEGLTIYSAGEFRNYEEASGYKQKIIEQGIEDAFIIAFVGERMLSIQEAKLLTSKQ